MAIVDVAALAAVAFVAASVAGSAGLGAGLVMTPAAMTLAGPAMTLAGPAMALTVGVVVSVAANAMIVAERRSLLAARDDRSELRRLLLAAWPAAAAGVVVFAHASSTQIEVAAAVVTLVSCAGLLAARGVRRPLVSGWAAWPAGATSGLLTTTVGLNGPPVVVYLVARRCAAGAQRQICARLFLALTPLAVAGPLAAGQGRAALDGLLVGVTLLPAVWAGARCGRWLFARFFQAAFRSVAITLVAASGTAALAVALG